MNSWNQCQQTGDLLILRSFCLTSKVGAQSLRPVKMGGGNQNFHLFDEINIGLSLNIVCPQYKVTQKKNMRNFVFDELLHLSAN